MVDVDPALLARIGGGEPCTLAKALGEDRRCMEPVTFNGKTAPCENKSATDSRLETGFEHVTNAKVG